MERKGQVEDRHETDCWLQPSNRSHCCQRLKGFKKQQKHLQRPRLPGTTEPNRLDLDGEQQTWDIERKNLTVDDPDGLQCYWHGEQIPTEMFATRHTGATLQYMMAEGQGTLFGGNIFSLLDHPACSSDLNGRWQMSSFTTRKCSHRPHGNFHIKHFF